MNDDSIYGTLKVYFYVAQPPHPGDANGRVRYSRRTLFTAYGITQGDAEISARDFRQLNGFTNKVRELRAQWQPNPIDFDD
jgi:hypothetical protein